MAASLAERLAEDRLRERSCTISVLSPCFAQADRVGRGRASGKSQSNRYAKSEIVLWRRKPIWRKGCVSKSLGQLAGTDRCGQAALSEPDGCLTPVQIVLGNRARPCYQPRHRQPVVATATAGRGRGQSTCREELADCRFSGRPARWQRQTRVFGARGEQEPASLHNRARLPYPFKPEKP
jgi:hypothetical protein